MALLETPHVETDQPAPDFTLKNIDGKQISLTDVKGKNGTVIAFICNHCPYVLGMIDRFVETANKLSKQDVNTIAIMPNDTKSYPADSYDKMQAFAKEHAFTFPYLIDETQEVAKAYGAVCTPDIFGLDKDLNIQYRGRLDSAGRNKRDENTVNELLEAMQDIAKNGSTDAQQFPSMGCSIKWKE